MEKKIVIFTDCGDTLVDESTEVRDARGVVIHCELIPGAKEALLALHARGHRIALVADGMTDSFVSILREHGIAHVFETLVISDAVGVEKPDPRMFTEAMREMGLTQADTSRIVMIGNNIRRDVAGANRMGICSILLSFTPRYRMQPTAEDQTPDYVVEMPLQLPPLLEQLELQQTYRAALAREIIPGYQYKE